ncbi:MAG: hypothetical protein JXB42_01745 [Deltaproteobacteria bacterium]|nr:hypothetical protein [Deltaproteobacteria bacterium]
MIMTMLKAVAGPLTSLITGWQERKRAQLDHDLQIAWAKTEAQIEKIKTDQAADIAWENTSIANSGWKDEWFTVILSIPAILCFVPGLADYVRQGFAALAETPDWYQWAFMIAVASSFGYKKIADFMALKKGA